MIYECDILQVLSDLIILKTGKGQNGKKYRSNQSPRWRNDAGVSRARDVTHMKWYLPILSIPDKRMYD